MLTFFKRAHLTTHPVAQRLFKLMDEKRTNLSIALDVASQAELLQLADLLGPHLCVLKTHVDILEDFTPSFGERLKAIAHRHNFLIFEDRKFADIGQTVALQYERGVYRISEWADLVNAHILPGPGIIEGLSSIGQPLQRGLLLLAEMSSEGNLATKHYVSEAVNWAENYSDFVCGFISMGKISDNPGMIHFTPGVKLHAGKDSLGQRYRTVEEVLTKKGSDIIIVGRDIAHAADPLAAAKQYQERAWECYKDAFS
jgi:orotidine 5'-phosphate decarboxylase subfamily 1